VKHPELLRADVDRLIAAPLSVTSVRDPEAAWALHVEDALAALPLVERRRPGTLIDVGSGGGSPGIPLAIETGASVTLLEARAPKAAFLRRTAAELGLSVEVLHARSETLAGGRGRDAWDVALARALAPPAAAVELCLPLVRPGGALVLWLAARELDAVDARAPALAGRTGDVLARPDGRAIVVVEKVGATPDGFPRRPGAARRRPPPSLRSRR
jgi:16S rRNA (guanine527-N7)-methyltransferase